MSNSNHQPCVLVTGAGRGLGRAIAERFRSEGYTVVATDYDASMLADLDGQEGYLTAGFDVGSTEAAQAVADKIRSEVGRLDVIVNNAGVMGFYPVSEAPAEMTVRVFQVNTFGPLRAISSCLDMLIESKGRVVNISSESAPVRTPFQSYASSKMALEALSDAMRRELNMFGVHIACVRPGAIATDMIEGAKAVKNDLENSRYQKFFGQFAEGVAKRMPKHPSKPSEVADTVYTAATDPKRKTLYCINNNRFLKILGKLPAKTVDNLLIKGYTPE